MVGGLFWVLRVEEGLWQCRERGLLVEMLQGDYRGVLGKWSILS